MSKAAELESIFKTLIDLVPKLDIEVERENIEAKPKVDLNE